MSTERDDASWGADQLRRQLQAMDDYDFEHLVADLWEKQEWETEVEQQSGDAGVDVRATKTSPYYRKVLIQAKRYSDDNPVGGRAVQQYSALKQQESDVDESIIVTTGRFTGPAEERGRDLNVKLIDGEDLVAMIDDLDAYDVVKPYISFPSASDSQPTTGETRSPRSSSSTVLPSEERERIEKYLGQDIESYLQDDEYRAIRALERAKLRVELNPHDAKELGIFDDLPFYDFEREFTDRKRELVLLKDDIHMDDGEVYVEDLTNYIKGKAIKGSPSDSVIGVIKRGVADEAWLSERGKDIWRRKKLAQGVKQTSRNLLSSLRSNETQETNSAEPTVRNNENISQEHGSPEVEHATGGEIESKESDTDGVPTGDKDPSDNDSLNQQDERADESKPGPATESGVQTETDVHRTPSTFDLTRTKWFYGVAAGTVGWLLVWVLFITLPNAGAIGGFVTFTSWLLLPVAIFFDTRKTGAFSASKVKSILYVVLSAVPLFAVIPGAVYLYRRENSWNA